VTFDTARVLIADAFILLGVVVMTIGTIGIVRMPDIYMKIHAASKSVFLGVCAILVGVMAESADPAIITRSILIGLLLVFTTPVAAYEIARAAAKEQFGQDGQSRRLRARPAGPNGREDEKSVSLSPRPHAEGS
jgi:multicomponent Na+:H+ antiporter subunit G